MRRSLYCLCLLLLASTADARESVKNITRSTTSVSPIYCTANHDVGQLSLLMTNGGVIGTAYYTFLGTPYDTWLRTCHLGSTPRQAYLFAGEYPLGSEHKCLESAALWVGAVTEYGDTLVSVGYDRERDMEFHPASDPEGEFQHFSLLDATKIQARSDQDYVAIYCDTFRSGLAGLNPDWMSGRPHQPLGLEVTQTSSQWSNTLVDDFVLIEYNIENIGMVDLEDMYVGLYLSPNVSHAHDLLVHLADDYVGFLPSYPSGRGCGFIDTVDIAWMADSDGDPGHNATEWVLSGAWASVRDITGVKLISAPPSANKRSFNWWVPWSNAEWDYGPRHRPLPGQMTRNFGSGTGTPRGDANKYFIMSNGEVDFDQPYVQEIKLTDPIWEYPSDVARDIWNLGSATKCLLSVGPFSLARGEEESVVFAYVGGRNFHIDPGNLSYVEEHRVDEWYDHVDFSDLVKNCKMAEHTYDNPGYDTDGDGYSGKYRVCVLDSLLVDSVWIPSIAETTYYAGDGVPDWRAVGPPPAPKFWLYPYDKGIRVRFNGLLSETTKDLVSNRIDFEGYRIYLGRDDREASLALAAGCDLKNYDKFVWNSKIYPSGGFEVQEVPFTLDQLRCLYGLGNDPCHDSLFDPLAYTAGAPFRLPGFLGDSIFYFVQHGYNTSRLGIDTPIRKIYPNQPKPIPGEPIPDSAYTEDGYLKYYEYECIIDGLLPTVPYYVNVTAIDYGDPAGGVEALESSKLLGLQDCYALENANQTGATAKPVYIYPNPYRTDAKYREMGYEGRGSDRINDRERRIHFANLPAKCWIRIHTRDGDMVREIRHDMDPNDPASDHDTWDLINRNIMAVESGLYYWSVEPDSGPVQIGKLVIIR